MKVQYTHTTELQNIFKILEFHTNLILTTNSINGRLVVLKDSFKDKGDLASNLDTIKKLEEELDSIAAYTKQTRELIEAYLNHAMNSPGQQSAKNPIPPLEKNNKGNRASQTLEQIDSIAKTLENFRKDT